MRLQKNTSIVSCSQCPHYHKIVEVNYPKKLREIYTFPFPIGYCTQTENFVYKSRGFLENCPLENRKQFANVDYD